MPLHPPTHDRAPSPPPASARRAALGEDDRRLLLSVLDVQRERSAAWQAVRDFRAVVETARAGKIIATLAQRAASDGFELPDAALGDELREALHESAVYNTRLLGELARAAAALERAGIGHVALKGAALMARHYPTPAMRQVVDLDLLIDPARFEAGLAALRGVGFVDAEHTAVTTFDGRSFAHALDAPHWHACAPLAAPSGVNVDLHRRVPTSGFAAGGGFAGLHARAVPATLHGVTVHMCHPFDLAVHLCEHFAVQNHAHPTDAPRLLCDLRALFPGAPPWARLQQGPARQRLAVAITRQLYEAAFAPRDERAASTRLLQRIAVADPALSPFLAELSELCGYAERFSVDLVQRPGFALRKLVPTRSYMAEHYGVDPRSPRIYSLYGKRLWNALTAPLRT